jgi:hypothetical protein
MASTSRKIKIARPAARKTGAGRSSTQAKAKAGSARQTRRSIRAESAAPYVATPVENPNPRRRFVELPKMAGELPTPVATFFF